MIKKILKYFFTKSLFVSYSLIPNGAGFCVIEDFKKSKSIKTVEDIRNLRKMMFESDGLDWGDYTESIIIINNFIWLPP